MNIVEYFLDRVRSNKLELTGHSSFLIMQLIKRQRMDRSLKDCELLRTLYLAIVEPALKAIGVTGNGIPYFVWSKFNYEANIIGAAISRLSKNSN
jgi:hypothetical protein